MRDSFRTTVAFPFVFAFIASLVITLNWFYGAEFEGYNAGLELILWPMIQAFVLSILVLETTCSSFSHDDVSFVASLDRSFRAAAGTFLAATIGATPMVWAMADLSESKGILILPLSGVLLLQCILTAWCIAVFANTLAPGTFLSRIVAYSLLFTALFGVASALRFIGEELTPLPFIRNNRYDAFSPFRLFMQRFVHDRPVSRLHLMYATSLTLFAVAGTVLLVWSFALAAARGRRPR